MDSVLYFCGDVHGEHDVLYEWAAGVEDCAAIQVGDFGIGFRQPQEDETILNHLGAALQARGNTLYVIRGNHDKPSWFDGRSYGGLTLVEDGSILTLDDKNLFCLGGAVSVDRSMRHLNEDWWEDEKMSWDGTLPEMPIHALVTHAGGSWTGLRPESPFLSAWHAKDPLLMAELRQEILAHDHLAEALLAAGHPLARWYCGHYHLPLHGEVGEVVCRVLDINEMAFWRWR